MALVNPCKAEIYQWLLPLRGPDNADLFEKKNVSVALVPTPAFKEVTLREASETQAAFNRRATPW